MSICVSAIVLCTLGNSKGNLRSCVGEPKQASNKAVVQHISGSVIGVLDSRIKMSSAAGKAVEETMECGRESSERQVGIKPHKGLVKTRTCFMQFY